MTNCILTSIHPSLPPSLSLPHTILYTQSSGPSAYDKFCDEFTAAQRAAICNCANGVQLHIVPPTLKHVISLLRTATTAEPTPQQGNVLYGIIITKEPGPQQYVDSSAEDIEKIIMAKKVFSAIPTTSSSSSSSLANTTPASVYPAASSRMGGGMAGQPPMPGGHGIPPPVLPSGAVPGHVPVTPAHPPIMMQPPPHAAPPIPPPVVRPRVTDEMMASMIKVAQFCAPRGASGLQTLRETEGALIHMPFIFDGQVGNKEFLEILRNLVFQQQALQQGR